MTRFEFYKAIVNSTIISNSTNPTDIALREYALAQYNKQAQEREDSAAKNAVILSTAIDLLKDSDSPIAAADLADKCYCSVQKASAVLRKAVTEGLMVSTPVLNSSGKGVKGYSLA